MEKQLIATKFELELLQERIEKLEQQSSITLSTLEKIIANIISKEPPIKLK